MNENNTIYKRLKNVTIEEGKELNKILNLSNDIKYDPIVVYKEYQSAAGHSIINLFRKEDITYKQILIDVADKLHKGIGWTHFKFEDSYTEEDIEKKIWEDLQQRATELKKQWDKLPNKKKKEKMRNLKEELKKEGYNQVAITSFIGLLVSGAGGVTAAAPAAISIFYSGFFASIAVGIFGVSTAALITSGLLISSIAILPIGIIAIGTPAYRKTIPMTVLLIQIGKRLELENDLKEYK
jgi:uncharacterized protein YaaW (UPF0174 family)